MPPANGSSKDAYRSWPYTVAVSLIVSAAVVVAVNVSYGWTVFVRALPWLLITGLLVMLLLRRGPTTNQRAWDIAVKSTAIGTVVYVIAGLIESTTKDASIAAGGILLVAFAALFVVFMTSFILAAVALGIRHIFK